MLQLFLKGGPLMWPLLILSVLTLTVALDRLWFLYQEAQRRRPADLERLLSQVEKGDIEAAVAQGQASPDFIVRVLSYALAHREVSLSNAYLQAAEREIKRFSRGLAVLDTVITLAPLLGLLGTVVGLIHSFSIMGDQELQAPAALTGGIAEALIATAFGMIIAVSALLPFNFLNARVDEARHQLEDSGTQAELLLLRKRT